MGSINLLTEPHTAYLAGLIDGEGSVSLTRLHRTENRRPVLRISNTDRALLEFAVQTVGAGRITNKTRSYDHHSPGYTYVIVNRQALALLARVHPYLRTYRAQRARLLLNEYVQRTPRTGRYRPEARF